MNTEATLSSVSAKKKRSWWFYALISAGVGLAGLVLLAVILAVGGYFYAKSAVNRFTTTAPKKVAKSQIDPQQAKQVQKELQQKWGEFSKATLNRQSPPPFKISADEINLIMGQQKPFRDGFQLVITNDQLLVEFSVPLDQSGIPQLKGRFLNGTARLNLVFQDGWLSATLGKVEANGQPVPNWLLSRFRGENFLKKLEQNRDFINMMQEVESVEIKDGFIVITPMK